MSTLDVCLIVAAATIFGAMLPWAYRGTREPVRTLWREGNYSGAVGELLAPVVLAIQAAAWIIVGLVLAAAAVIVVVSAVT